MDSWSSEAEGDEGAAVRLECANHCYAFRIQVEMADDKKSRSPGYSAPECAD